MTERVVVEVEEVEKRGVVDEESEEEYQENGEDDVESHYEPVVVAPGVKLQARAGGRTTAELDDDVEAIYAKWIEDRMKKAITERSCTFIYTDRIYALQRWYPCKTCLASGKFKGSEAGACEVCKDLCHKGHDLGPENYSIFVCSCGEGKCAVTQTAKERDVFDDYRILLTKTIEKEKKIHLHFSPGKTFTQLNETIPQAPGTPTHDSEDTPLRKKSSPTHASRNSPQNSPRHTPSTTPPLTPKPSKPTRSVDESTLDDSRRKMEHNARKDRTRSGSFCG